MFVHYRSQGIVLKKVDRKEADQLFTIYTKDFGKLKVLGRGIRKISSKLRSGMEMLCLSEIGFIQGKTYKTLTDAVLIEKFQNINKDLEKINIANNILEILNTFIRGEELQEDIWNLLVRTLKQLDIENINIQKQRLIYHYFFWNFLSLLGYKPELYRCAACQKRLNPEKLFFNQVEGGVICQDCFLKKKSGRVISSDAVKILRIILNKKEKIILRLKVENNLFSSLEDISKDCLKTFNIEEKSI